MALLHVCGVERRRVSAPVERKEKAGYTPDIWRIKGPSEMLGLNRRSSTKLHQVLRTCGKEDLAQTTHKERKGLGLDMGLSGTYPREWPKARATLAAQVSVTGLEETAKQWRKCMYLRDGEP
jgi:hypothetical protein